MSSEEDRATAIDNMHQKFGEDLLYNVHTLTHTRLTAFFSVTIQVGRYQKDKTN